MRYKVNPGVVKTRVCGVFLLIPLRSCGKSCRCVKQLTPLWAMTWDSLTAGHSLEDQIQAHKILTRLPEETVRPRIKRFIDDLVSKGFLLEESGSSALP